MERVNILEYYYIPSLIFMSALAVVYKQQRYAEETPFRHHWNTRKTM
jgi:hypothetical protein